jgi:opacity protein-like surface antigen
VSQKPIYLALLLLFAVFPAQAQYSDHNSIELTPFGGSRFGGSIDFSNGDFLNIKSSWDYGAMADVDLVPHLQGEFMWNRQPTQLTVPSPGGSTPVTNATLDMFQWSLLVYPFPRGAKFIPYFVGGAGFDHFDTRGFLPGFDNKFAYNIGIGVKYFFLPHVGIRLEGRYSPTHTTSSAAVFCNPFFCQTGTIANFAEQGQANLGIIFRF